MPKKFVYAVHRHPTTGAIDLLCYQVSGNERRFHISVAEAIREIERGSWHYVVRSGNTEVTVDVVSDQGRKYLRTNPNGFLDDNLSSLPDCKVG